jgi:hypothetical protein
VRGHPNRSDLERHRLARADPCRLIRGSRRERRRALRAGRFGRRDGRAIRDENSNSDVQPLKGRLILDG